MPLTDPLFYFLAVPAIIIFGISKGGFGGGMGVLAVPLMSLAVAPPVAAAILLPILCLMDLQTMWAYRGRWNWSLLRVLLPASVIGIAIGGLSFRYLQTSHVKLIIGAIALGFTLNYWLKRKQSEQPAKAPNKIKGGFWGAVAGFTSFTAHAGGPPISVYLLPLKLDKTLFQATTVVFFTVVNYVKLVPYALLGQFSSANLATSLVLAPLAFIAIGLGVRLHNKVSVTLFYRVCYVFLFLAGLKLLYDGLIGILGA